MWQEVSVLEGDYLSAYDALECLSLQFSDWAIRLVWFVDQLFCYLSPLIEIYGANESYAQLVSRSPKVRDSALRPPVPTMGLQRH